MEGSRVPDPILSSRNNLAPRIAERSQVMGLLGITSVAIMLAVPVQTRADTFEGAPLGQPIILFSPSGAAAGSPSARKPVVTPDKRPAAAQKAPLIPPVTSAKLGPPPAVRPALPLETDLQPLSPPPDTPGAGQAAPAAAKPTS
jgi:hypothetical protein